MPPLEPFFAPLILAGDALTALPKRGRKALDPGSGPMTNAAQLLRCRAGKRETKLRNIAILDMETDPFDPEKRDEIFPFVCELYSDQFGAIVIWDENFESFRKKVIDAIESLAGEYTIYAHNGGKFDYLFLVRWLRGIVKFKGRALMVAKVGKHELRDSLHILPEKLAAWKKDHFDYSKMKRCNRARYRQEILDYLHSDCVYLFDIVRSFVNEFGLKLSIGQAAFSELKKSYRVSHVTPQTDKFMRRYFFGGRVECISGAGLFESGTDEPFKLYDVNSMYPYVMASYRHPIGSGYSWRRGEPAENTIFLDIECAQNNGAFLSRTSDFVAGMERGTGRFFTTIWEFNVALRHRLISDYQIVGCVDCDQLTTFEKFIAPMYDRRQEVKRQMAELRKLDREDTTEFEELKKQDLFLKYLLNNSYGKFAQNPERFKEYYYTDSGVMPDQEWMQFLNDERAKLLTLTQGSAEYEAVSEFIHRHSMPIERSDNFDIWAKPAPGRRYNNVGTAASITGAARSVLLDAQNRSRQPIYCDTDSLICREISGVQTSDTKLGAWKIEETFDAVIIAGKKEYACKISGRGDDHERRIKARCKGADIRVTPADPDAAPLAWRKANAATWDRYLSLLRGDTIVAVNKAPTLTKTGAQSYLVRHIKATASRS